MSCVLVFDDEPLIRELIAEVLWDAGYEVRTAQDGAAALGKVREHPPALVLLDQMMPEMNGWDFLRSCRDEELCEGVPILLMSAAPRSPKDEVIRPERFLANPFDLDALVGIIQALA